MSPQVTAAWIAVSGVVLTVIATVVVQYLSRRATKGDLEKQREYLNETLEEQRTQTLNERFATAAGQLGSDKPEVRLAGVYAMAGLADDWKKNRQTCVDVLCGYLRMPYEPDPGLDVSGAGRHDFRASREVRHTVIRVITEHLRDGAAVSWQRLKFDFTGVVFDGGDFSGAVFSGGRVRFREAVFSGGTVNFYSATFRGGTVDFSDAAFSGATVNFDRAAFKGDTVGFIGAKFSDGKVGFSGAKFSGGTVSFSGAKFSGATISFGITFSGGMHSFEGARFSGGVVSFRAGFEGGQVSFNDAVFSGGTVDFSGARFSGATISFRAGFSGGTVDFSGADDFWSSPPTFPWVRTGKLPLGVKLPKKDGRPQT